MKIEAKKYKVLIFNREYTIVSDESQEQVKEAASYVDMLMNDIASKAPNAEEHTISVLAALRIAHDLLNVERKAQENKQRATKLVHYIDNVL